MATMTAEAIGWRAMQIERGRHRAVLRRLSETRGLSFREISDEARQLYIELAMRNPPLVSVDGDFVAISSAEFDHGRSLGRK